MNINDFIYDTDTDVVLDEWLWERIRLWRNNELKATDWTQLPDAPVDAEEWSIYRQLLRELPLQSDDPHDVVFPVRPE